MANTIRNAHYLFAYQAAPAVNGGGLRRAVAWLNRMAIAVAETGLRWSERAAQRRLLATLDDRLLEDIGVSRAEAAREASKPFWQA